jgi:NAD(P)-dependent dehydrogenase (short-subunit alcohol dehydrogenase family)
MTKTAQLAIACGLAETTVGMRPTSLLQHFATPEEGAALVAFVCSPLSSATNGAALRADGGVVRSIL